MTAHRRPALILGIAALLVAGSSAWLVAASDDADAGSPDSTADDAVTVYEDLDDPEGVVVSGEIAREIRRALDEAMAGVDEAMEAVRGLSVSVEPLDLDDDRGRVRILVDHDGDSSEAVIDPVDIQRQVDQALRQVDFDRLGVELEQSMEQLGEELGRMGEQMSRAFEDAHGAHSRHRRTVELDSARDENQHDEQLDVEVRRLKSEIRALKREIRRLESRRNVPPAGDFD